MTPAEPGRFLFQLDSNKRQGMFHSFFAMEYNHEDYQDGISYTCILHIVCCAKVSLSLTPRSALIECRAEVESFINRAVKQALSEIPSAHVHQDVLAGKLVQALESEASWVELYGITGEIIVPGLSIEDDVFDGALTRAMEVKFSAFPVRFSANEHFRFWNKDAVPKKVTRTGVSLFSLLMSQKCT